MYERCIEKFKVSYGELFNILSYNRDNLLKLGG